MLKNSQLYLTIMVGNTSPGVALRAMPGTPFRKTTLRVGETGGAGEGNRTLIASLEGWSFTTKLHPHTMPPDSPFIAVIFVRATTCLLFMQTRAR